jgi:hypothetical protein
MVLASGCVRDEKMMDALIAEVIGDIAHWHW